MEFTWDPAKSEQNLRLRGFDFAFATGIFRGPTLEREDQRRDYDKHRIIATGLVGGLELTVVYTDRRRSEAAIERRIISARRSNRHERKAYQASFQGR